MNESKQLAIRFREVLLNGTWIANTNFKHQLQDITWQEATIKIGSLNTIAALAFHISYYVAGVLNVLKGGTLDIKDKYSYDMPPIHSQKDWENLLNKLWRDVEEFANLVAQLSDEKLKMPFVDEKYGSYERNIEAMIEHSYYHLGQVVLIKKMLQKV